MKATILVIFLIAKLSLAQNCPWNQIAFQDGCFDQCPPNTVVTYRNGLAQCQECDVTKFLVLSPDNTRCQCATQSYALAGSVNQCAPCHFTCLQCSGPLSTQCLTCDTAVPTTFRVRTNKGCVCSNGFTENTIGETAKCQPCHSDCQTCSGTADTDCTLCAYGRIKNQFGICACANQFVDDQNGNCICPAPLILMPDGICRNVATLCGYNQQASSQSTIKSIIGAALQSKGSSQKLCNCAKGLVRIKGKCGTCLTNQVFNNGKGKCECDPRANEHEGQCILCDSTQVFNKKTGECDCKKNTQKAVNGTCISCPPKSTLGANGCECIFNYFMQGNKCKKCGKKTDNPSCQDAHHNTDKPRMLQLSELRNIVKDKIASTLAAVTGSPFIQSIPGVTPFINNSSNSV